MYFHLYLGLHALYLFKEQPSGDNELEPASPIKGALKTTCQTIYLHNPFQSWSLFVIGGCTFWGSCAYKDCLLDMLPKWFFQKRNKGKMEGICLSLAPQAVDSVVELWTQEVSWGELWAGHLRGKGRGHRTGQGTSRSNQALGWSPGSSGAQMAL